MPRLRPLPSRLSLLGLAIVLGFPLGALGCASGLVDRGSYAVDPEHRAVSHDPRIRYLVLHYTALDEARSMHVLTKQEVSAHYLVPRDPFQVAGRPVDKPVIHALVPENERAWHAGISHWQRASDLNDASIGVEIVNGGPLDKERRTWAPFDDRQIEAVILLAKDIVTRYGIPPTRVVGHADIAPQRKEDPGPLFPWETLARAGVGAWPDPGTVTAELAERDPKLPVGICLLQSKLATWGYDVPLDGVLDHRTRRVFQAFQMHYRPRDYAGDPDAETDAIASALLLKYPPSPPVGPEPHCP